MTNLMRLIWLRRLFKGGGGSVIKTISGVAPLVFTALSGALHSLTQYGLCVQDGTPTPSAPVDIVCNNGAIKYGVLGKNLYNAATDIDGKYIDKDGVIGDNASSCISALIPVTAGATYVYSGVTGRTGQSNNKRIHCYADGVWQSQISVFVSSAGDAFAQTFTVPAGTNGVRFSHWASDTQSMVELGSTATEYEPYKGMGIYTDGAPEVISVGGFNIFNKDSEQRGNYYVNSNGNVATANTNASIYFRCQPNTTYYFMHTAVTGGTRTFTVSADEWTIGTPANAMVGATTSTAGTVRSITTEADAKWIFFLYGRSSGTAATFEEQAADFIVSTYPLTSSTQYEPYKGEPQTASAVNLFAVGDYEDMQDIISGAVTRNVGVIVFDGTETTWALSDSGTTHRFRGTKPSDCYTPASRARLVSTHFVYISAGQTLGGAFIGASQYWYFIPTDQTMDTVEKWKAFLAAQYEAGTPIIVMYPLAEATTESVTPQGLSTVAGTNVIDVTAEVDDIEFDVEYKGAAS